MSQFGMQLPGQRGRQSAVPGVYTALLLFAVAALATATGVLYFAASSVSPESGNPIALQREGSIRLPQ